MPGTQERKISEEEERLVPKGILKITSKELSRITLTRKACEYCMRYPYRKPTQVDEERILRRTGEALLRNSAN